MAIFLSIIQKKKNISFPESLSHKTSARQRKCTRNGKGVFGFFSLFLLRRNVDFTLEMGLKEQAGISKQNITFYMQQLYIDIGKIYNSFQTSYHIKHSQIY